VWAAQVGLDRPCDVRFLRQGCQLDFGGLAKVIPNDRARVQSRITAALGKLEGFAVRVEVVQLRGPESATKQGLALGMADRHYPPGDATHVCHLYSSQDGPLNFRHFERQFEPAGKS